MQFIFSILSLVIIVGIAVWWAARDVALVVPPQSSPESTVPSSPIEQANEAKRLLESKGGISIDLSGQNLSAVPKSVFEMTDAQTLNLSNNNLSGSLPGEIRLLQNLRTLDLSGNKFTGVPAEIGQLTKLENLNLSNNRITGLPHELGRLTNLKVLNLTGNDYSKMDLEIIKKTLPATVIIKTN